MKKTIEVSVSYIDRTQDQPQGHTAGIIVFDQEDPMGEPEVKNPLDFKTLAILKHYIDQTWADHEELKAFADAALATPKKPVKRPAKTPTDEDLS